MKYFIKHTLALLFLFSSAHTFCQQITASVDKNPVGEGDKFHFNITVKNAKGNIAMPDLKDFNVMSGPNQTSRVQIINGVKEETYSLSWLLFPKRKGKFIIKPISTNSNNLTYPPVSVEVVAGMASTEPLIDSQRTETKDHFGKIYVSNSQPYLGEQIIVTYVIYNSVRGFNPQYDFANTLEGFWKEELKLEPKWEDKLENINGRNYQKAVIGKQILFPQKPGELVIDPFEVNGNTGGFFRQRVNFKSNRVTINVKPLPNGAPEGFTGAVGNFNFEFDVDKRKVETNEAFNLKIKISGKGNLNLVNELPVDFPSDFEVYDPELRDNISKSGAGMSGSRTFEYLIIPRHAGVFEIDGISFSYFDPGSKKYRTRSAEDLVIEVEKSQDESDSELPLIVRKKDIELLENDIRFISKAPNLREKGSAFFGSGPYIGTILTPALGFLLFLFIRKRKEEELADVIGFKKRKAGKMAAKHLQEAKKALHNGNTSVFYEELHIGLTGYLCDKIGLSTSDLTKETVQQALGEKNVTNEVVSSFINLLSNCEMAKYAPTVGTDPTQMLKSGEIVINNLEEQIT